MTRKKLPLGIENFARLVDPNNHYCFVDKTLMIKELLDSEEVISLLLRPRCWGKSLNLSMLHHFFSSNVSGHPTHGLFNALKIGQADNGKYLAHQGKHPVIFITFQWVKQLTFEGVVNKIKGLIQDICQQHIELKSSPKLNKIDKQLFGRMLDKTLDLTELCASLKNLSMFFKKTSQHYSFYID